VFCAGLCIAGTAKDFGARGWLNAPVRIGGVVVRPNDLVCGDADGVVIVPHALVEKTLAASVAREADEAQKIRSIRAGERTVDLYKFGMS
jgi:4-hydroxy-4-methyl-2-oxoglutarate aldolase